VCYPLPPLCQLNHLPATAAGPGATAGTGLRPATHLFWTKQQVGVHDGAQVSGHVAAHIGGGGGGGGGGSGAAGTGIMMVCSWLAQQEASHAGQQFCSPAHGAGQEAIG